MRECWRSLREIQRSDTLVIEKIRVPVSFFTLFCYHTNMIGMGLLKYKININALRG